MSTKTRISDAHAVRMTGGGSTVLFAYAAGAVGIVANALLIAFFAFQFGRPEGGISFGTANDLVGSLATALMIPVALAGRLPRRRSVRIVRTFGVGAMAVLTVGGPLLVFGAVSFEVQGPIMTAAWMVLCVWLFSVNRCARLSGALPRRTARFGEVAGAGLPVGGVLVGVGFLLPWMSWGQWVLFGVGGVFGLVGFLGIPVWFLLLGRNFAVS